MRPMLKIIGVMLGVVGGFAFSPPMAHAASSDRDPVETLRTLRPPLTVQNAVAFMGKGVYSLELVDADRRRVRFALDTAARLPPELETIFGKGKPQTLVFLGAGNPSDKLAVPLDPGGADEKRLVDDLNQWKDSWVNPDDIEMAVKVGLDEDKTEENLTIVNGILEALQKRGGSP